MSRAVKPFFSDDFLFYKLDEKNQEKELPEWVQLMSEYEFPIGYDREGELITKTADKSVFNSFIKNFKANAKGTKTLLDYGHESYGVAAGEIKGLKVEKDKNGKDALFIKVDWTTKAKESIVEGEWHYLSAEFSFAYPNEDGKDVGPTLLGGGLTNRPRIKKMKEVYAFSDTIKKIILSGENKVDYKEKAAKLEEEKKEIEKKMAAMKKEIDEMKKKADDSQEAPKEVEKADEQAQKISELENKLLLSEKMKKIVHLFDEGKVLPEQLKLAEESTSPQELETIIKFAEKSVPVKTNTLSENSNEGVNMTNVEDEKFEKKLSEEMEKNGGNVAMAAKEAYRFCDKSKLSDTFNVGNVPDDAIKTKI